MTKNRVWDKILVQWIIDQTYLYNLRRRNSLQQKCNYYIITLFMRNSSTSSSFSFISTNDNLHKRYNSNSSSIESYFTHCLPNPQIMLHMCTFPHAACSCRDYCSTANQYRHCVGPCRNNVGNVTRTEIHSKCDTLRILTSPWSKVSLNTPVSLFSTSILRLSF